MRLGLSRALMRRAEQAQRPAAASHACPGSPASPARAAVRSCCTLLASPAQNTFGQPTTLCFGCRGGRWWGPVGRGPPPAAGATRHSWRGTLRCPCIRAAHLQARPHSHRAVGRQLVGAQRGGKQRCGGAEAHALEHLHSKWGARARGGRQRRSEQGNGQHCGRGMRGLDIPTAEPAVACSPSLP